MLRNFLNHAIQASNRRTLPTEIITEAIEVFQNQECRSELISLAFDIKDLKTTENNIKKQIQINGKPHNALSLNISIKTPEKLLENVNSDQNSYLNIVDKIINPSDLVAVTYALNIHYGNGKTRSSQVIATHTEYFEITDKILKSSEISIKKEVVDETSKHYLNFSKTKSTLSCLFN